jgi:hypothetical protein
MKLPFLAMNFPFGAENRRFAGMNLSFGRKARAFAAKGGAFRDRPRESGVRSEDLTPNGGPGVWPSGLTPHSPPLGDLARNQLPPAPTPR